MSKAPMMPVYPDALMADTTHLSAEEFGAYWLILCATWRNDGQPFPDDDRRLARVCRTTPTKWRKLRPILAPFFDLTDGHWCQKRLEKEWFSAQKKIARNRQNGMLGGRPKVLETLKTENPVGSVSDNPGESQRLSIQNQIQEELTIEATASMSTAAAAPDEVNPLPVIDPKRVIFGQCLNWLAKLTGKPPDTHRPMIGKWVSTHGEAAVLSAFQSASRAPPIDPIAWIAETLNREPARSANVRPKFAHRETAVEATDRRRAGLAAAVARRMGHP